MRWTRPRMFRCLFTFLLLGSTVLSGAFFLRGHTEAPSEKISTTRGSKLSEKDREINNDYYNVEEEEIEQPPAEVLKGSNVQELSCVINGRERHTCLRRGAEVFVPFFGVIKDYFEITGTISKNATVFEWWHNSTRIRLPKNLKYTNVGTFGPFGGYNVELRDRVRCISGSQGVPMSTQWGQIPYYYPIQVAQFALEHYSKNLTRPTPNIRSYEEPSLWGTTKFDPSTHAFHILRQISLNLDPDPLLVIQVEAALEENANISIIVERLDTKETLRIDYVQTEEVDSCIDFSEESFIIPLGTDVKWRRITRNILTDLTRAVSHQLQQVNHRKQSRNRKLKLHPQQIRLRTITFSGNLWVKGLSQRSSAHMDQFLDGADWFLRNQESNGGWTVPVKRSLASDLLVLEPGWVSAMGQGHGISVLTRAHAITRNPAYLNAAIKAAELFNSDAKAKGVRNWFLESVPWYEEYPTTPGSFVLNGFIYSLFGLYDLKMTLTDVEEAQKIAKLYETGINSLRTMLPLYDTGSGSYYDLRHVTVQGIAPNLARWDYHSLHIYQLMWLYSIEPNPLFKDFAERWIGYAFGKRAKHN